MSPVEFKKRLCRPVEFKGQGPLPWPSGWTHGRRDGPTAVGTDPRSSGWTHGRWERRTAVGNDVRPSGLLD